MPLTAVQWADPLSGCWFKGEIYIFAMLFWEVPIWIRRRGFPQNARHG